MEKFIIKKRAQQIQITCRIEEDLLDRIENIVIKQQLDSRNGFINECIRFALDNIRYEENE